MPPPATTLSVHPSEIATLLRGESAAISAWSEVWSTRRVALHIVVIVAGAGVYGAAMGWWRDPQQAAFVAIKFPLILLLTMLGNALINGMMVPLLGLNIPFRQSFSAIVMGFTIAAAILGAFSPLIAFMVWHAPPLSASALSTPVYVLIKLTHVAVITFAGTMGNVRLLQLLVHLGGSWAVTFRVLVAWLAENLFLGSQIAWVRRPFIWAAKRPVEFIGPEHFQGSFFETAFRAEYKLICA